MPTPPLSDETLLETLRIVFQHGNVSEAARALGIPRPTLQGRYAQAKAKFPDELTQMVNGR